MILSLQQLASLLSLAQTVTMKGTRMLTWVAGVSSSVLLTIPLQPPPKRTTKSTSLQIFKSSSSTLNEKSLEMCTESLGSETGSEVSESSDDTTVLPVENVNYEIRETPKSRETRRASRSASFPPPLSSIRGPNNVRVRSHREGGRLVMEAVSVSSCHVYLHAERAGGRLRLHLMNNCSSNNPDNEEQESEAEAEAESGEEIVVEEGGENDESGDDHDAEGGDDIWGEDLEGSSVNTGGEMGRLARPGTCKEGGSTNKSLLNWKPFWVAT
ncbi:hypothetical protein OIU84_005404 [Salix udensis]|uniref:FAF domain-containing protein n=1 Tax=Salix udensis TaxID=889485 RepID=A0AAD6JVY6_9ROSI|nr:hypothetical protein OIU84_005404 [Salix udensis]